MSARKVFILTEGNKKIGFGHITRGMSLYQAFETRGIVPEFLINGDNSILDLVKGANYQMFDWFDERKRLFEIIADADIVIVDSYLADKSLYDKISKAFHNRILVIIDDYNRIEYPVGIIVNPSIYGHKVNYTRKEGTTYLLGNDYVILQKEFWNVPPKSINKGVKNILITFGGINHSDLVYKIVNNLKNKFGFTFNAITAKSDYSSESETINFYEQVNAKTMRNLMLKADICISGGGQTSYELAKVGVPSIGICFAENQKLNLEGWYEKGVIAYAGWHKGDNLLEKIETTINKLVPYEERVHRSKQGRNYIDGKGAKRIVSDLLKKCEYGIGFKK